MTTPIQQKLLQIEQQQNVRILLAVESGSRAWGFASPDSDYDVRFIYVRPQNDYLKLESTRDVIELPIDDTLDINGWDLQKTLRLLHKSNPTLFEWFSSPIVYMETPFADRFRALMTHYFSSKKTLYHYISMAKTNYREYLKTDMVKAKKYFYVLRPVLACNWVLHQGTPPPMLFSDLARAELPTDLSDTVHQLLDLKIHAPEIKEIPKIKPLNTYLDSEIQRIKKTVTQMPENRSPSWEELNILFLSEINQK